MRILRESDGIDGATSPAVAWNAYQSEFNSLYQQFEAQLQDALKRLEALAGHAGAYAGDVMSKPEIKNISYQPQAQMPDVSARLAALKGKYGSMTGEG